MLSWEYSSGRVTRKNLKSTLGVFEWGTKYKFAKFLHGKIEELSQRSSFDLILYNVATSNRTCE
jgi:hypothetical protein